MPRNGEKAQNGLNQKLYILNLLKIELKLYFMELNNAKVPKIINLFQSYKLVPRQGSDRQVDGQMDTQLLRRYHTITRHFMWRSIEINLILKTDILHLLKIDNPSFNPKFESNWWH